MKYARLEGYYILDTKSGKYAILHSIIQNSFIKTQIFNLCFILKASLKFSFVYFLLYSLFSTPHFIIRILCHTEIILAVTYLLS